MSKPTTSQLMEDRIAQLGSWLDDESPFTRFDQRHLESGTPEQAYWHLGYMTALQDALALIQDAGNDTESAPPGAPGDTRA